MKLASFTRTTRAIGVALLCLGLMSGCYKIDMDVTISSDDTVSGTVIVGMSRDLPGVEEIVAQMRVGIPADVDVKDWSDDRFIGFEITYRDQPIAYLARGTQFSPAVNFQLRRDGDHFLLGDPNAVSESPDLGSFTPIHRVRFTFPGEVVEGNGVKDGNSMEWTDPTVVPWAKAKATGGLLVPILLVAGGVLVLAAAVIVAIVLLRRKNAQPTLTGAPGPNGPTQQPWDQQQAAAQDQCAGPQQIPWTQAPRPDQNPAPGQPPPGQQDDGGSESPWSRP